jgi:hypothetical protein
MNLFPNYLNIFDKHYCTFDKFSAQSFKDPETENRTPETNLGLMNSLYGIGELLFSPKPLYEVILL